MESANLKQTVKDVYKLAMAAQESWEKALDSAYAIELPALTQSVTQNVALIYQQLQLIPLEI